MVLPAPCSRLQWENLGGRKQIEKGMMTCPMLHRWHGSKKIIRPQEFSEIKTVLPAVVRNCPESFGPTVSLCFMQWRKDILLLPMDFESLVRLWCRVIAAQNRNAPTSEYSSRYCNSQHRIRPGQAPWFARPKFGLRSLLISWSCVIEKTVALGEFVRPNPLSTCLKLLVVW